MKVLRKFYPEVRLRRLLRAPGGVKIVDAISRAEAAVEDIRDHCMAALDAKIAQLMALSGILGRDEIDGCYGLSNEIFAEAGAFGLTELSGVALSLCQLLSSERPKESLSRAARVHVEAMALLRSPAAAGSLELRTIILKELRVLSKRAAA